MDSIVGSVLVVIVTGAIGVVTYSWQEHKKRETTLAERRKTHYEGLVRNFFELLVAKSGADRSVFVSEIEKGWLFASDDVLQACYRCLETYDELAEKGLNAVEQIRNDPDLQKAFQKNTADMFLAMRKDLRSTRITEDWARRNLRIYTWGIISRP
jgi:hypothetical protein